MKNKTKKIAETLSLFTNPEDTKLNNEDRKIIINKTRFMEILKRLLNIKDLSEFKKELLKLKVNLNSTYSDTLGVLNIDTNGDTIEMRKKYLLQEIKQMESALTIQRAKYYLQRLVKSITEKKTGKINDINLNRWKEYEEIIPDSLWIFDKRDTSGAHLAWYWGNFIPQIPRQMMLRYTKQGEWVLDPFVGSGTTLIECRRLGRNGIGIELNPEVAERARNLVNKQLNKHSVITEIITGDSTVLDFKQLLEKNGIKKVQLLIMHPPYHDIIKFSNDPKDLLNAPTVEEFLKGGEYESTYSYNRQ